MDGAALHRLSDEVTAVPGDCADRERLQALLADVRRLTSWCQSREVWAGNG